MADNPFERMISGRSAAQPVAAESASFERESVRYVTREMGLTSRHVNALLDRYEALTGKRELRFSTFNEAYSSFPVFLGSHTLRCLGGPWPKPTGPDYCVHRDMSSVEPQRFKRFGGVPFVVAYQDFYNASFREAAGRPIGLVFPRRGFMRGMIIHNDASERFWREGLSWVYKVPGTENRLYVQPFIFFLQAIKESGVFSV
jgi:hypothetical protein